MERIIDTIKLMAKTGLFFAHCDGDYTDRERDFVEGFLAGIEQIGSVDDEVKNAVLDSVNHTYTLDEVLEETKQLVAGGQQGRFGREKGLCGLENRCRPDVMPARLRFSK